MMHSWVGPNKDYVEDNGGRDITMMAIMAKSLNFTFDNVDPRAYGIKRSRGSA